MKTYEINVMLKNVYGFVGVFPRDLLPLLDKDCSVVVNTDTCSEPGTHWVAIYVEKNCGEYFDSFGLPPLTSDIMDVLNQLKSWKYNTATIQDIASDKCGDFCVAFIRMRSKGETLEDFIHYFHTNTKTNDAIVATLLHH